METFSALLALCTGNSLVTGLFTSQRPVMWSFDVFCDLRLNNQLRKQSLGWWFETPSCPLWRHCNVDAIPWMKIITIAFSLRFVSWGLTDCGQDFSSHNIDKIEYVSPYLTWGRIISTCVKSMWRTDMICEYMFLFPLNNLARKGLI